MKKLFKFAGAVAVIGAAVAGGVTLYKKFFAPEDNFEDLDDDFEDDFEDEDLDFVSHTERGYVPLSTAAKETAASVGETVVGAAKEAGETVKEAAKEAGETVKEAADQVGETAAEAAKEVQETL